MKLYVVTRDIPDECNYRFMGVFSTLDLARSAARAYLEKRYPRYESDIVFYPTCHNPEMGFYAFTSGGHMDVTVDIEEIEVDPSEIE